MAIVLAPTAVGVVIVVAILASQGVDDDSVIACLLATARVALAMFLLSFVARPLRDLFPSGTTRTLVAYRKWLGLSFALAMLFHVVLIATLFSIHAPAAPPQIERSDYVLGGPGLLAVALLALLSNNGLHRRMGQRWWRLINLVGISWIWTVFFMCFTMGAPARGEDMRSPYLWVPLGLLIVAMLVRIAASVANVVRGRRPGLDDVAVILGVVGAYLVIAFTLA